MLASDAAHKLVVRFYKQHIYHYGTDNEHQTKSLSKETKSMLNFIKALTKMCTELNISQKSMTQEVCILKHL